MEILRKLFSGRADNPQTTARHDELRLARLRDRIDPTEHMVTPTPWSAPAQASTKVPGFAGPLPRPVVLARKPWVRDHDWTRDSSWFGGLPKLGGASWPRGTDGRPLPFAAQINLAELAAACPESPLPRDGWLAFFLNEGAVVHVRGGELEPTPAPEGLPLAYTEGGGDLFPEHHSQTSRRLFPYWPVEAIGLPLPKEMRVYADPERHEEIWDMQRELLTQQLPVREYSFSAYSAREAGIKGADRLWWYGALHVQDKLRDALASVERAVALRESWIQCQSCSPFRSSANSAESAQSRSDARSPSPPAPPSRSSARRARLKPSGCSITFRASPAKMDEPLCF